MATVMQRKIGLWFWLGSLAWLVGSLWLTAYLVTAAGELEGMLFAAAMSFVGGAAMLAGLIAKAVEIGVRAANDE